MCGAVADAERARSGTPDGGQMRIMRRAVLALTALTLTACEYAGAFDGAFSRNLKWFSYVGAEDIRKACGPGADDRYRFVYNGIYDKQIRSYDVHMLPGGKRASMTAFARAEPNLARSLSLSDIGKLWDGRKAQSTLSIQGISELRTALSADRFRTDRPRTLRLPSNEFYWTGAACIDGRFHTNAWLYPSDRFGALRFPAVLMRYDRTEVPFYESRPINARDDDPTHDGGDKGEGSAQTFLIQLGADGFVGTGGLF